ncbi:outer membrane protein assembly factor [Planctomyces sp. SH-PL62]|uniref:BamA/OMP85 family outer membrane protein n=1 Tax=Planctomyces sp. SH-PL62 TaxID=1636152 RepID=UPI00078B7B5A|nr:POTRA domain-containing protein [Planctomyces sp. SH-PL62]AMV37411.1 Outer membrane protein assembly factor BamA precursor [Planctomyces sp. SH-PL62]
MERNLIEADVINKRPPRRRPRAARVLAFVAALLGLAAAASTASAQAVPKGTVVEIRVEGNSGITAEKIRGKLLSKTNAPFDQQKVDADLRTLIGTKWFTDVQPFYEEKPPGSGEIVLIFRVKEMPILRSVEFRGRRKIPLKEIEENTGLKVGNRADPTRTRLAVQQIERLYVEKGYELAQVSLLEGGEADTTKVVIQIFEGPKYQLASIDFKGNVFATDAQLWNKISSRKPILAGFGGKYHRDMLDEDARKLIEYYQSQGFFEVRVAPVTRPGEGLGDVHLTFVVSEGVRYHVRDLVFEGNSRIKEEQLRDGLQLHSGKPFLDVVRDADREAMLKRYYELGCIKTQIVAEPRFSNEPGVVDLVYKIEESMPFTLGEIVVRGNSRTRDEVIRREFWQAGLLPGEVLDQNRLALAQQRLRNLGYFNENPEMGKQIEVKIVNERPFDKPYRDLMMPLISEIGSTRMQAADEPAGAAAPREIARAGAPAPVAVATTPLSATTSPSANAAPAAAPRVRMQGEDYSVVPAPVDSAVGGADSGPSMLQPFGSGSGGYFSPPADTVPPIRVPAPAAEPAPGFLGAAPPAAPGRSQPPVGSGEPPGSFPSIPGLNMTDVGPDRNDPFPNRSYADIVTTLEEAPTGRLMVGVAASSFQGLFGNVTVYEKNFDLFNVPRSFNDIFNGMAFRGGGQEFRLDLQPGTLINRFQASLRDPYLLGLPIGGAAAGYYFNRLYPDWSESRGGGRFSLGRQFGTSTYADVAARVEDVNFYGYRSPAPAQYLAASGHSFLASLRPSLRFDNRNSPFMATKGQYAELSFEQGWGTYTWSKFDAEGRVHYTTGSRPDGTGKRFVTLRGHFGIATQSLPVYERFFAGNFGSLRGFQYRTVSPKAMGVPTGGVMMALGSLEYQFPWTAADTVHQVVFTDFGTVENDYSFNKLRVSVGTGLRLMVPALGPVPLGFDIAIPVMSAEGDALRYFNFSMSASY